MHCGGVDDAMSVHIVLYEGGGTGMVKADVGCIGVGWSAPEPLCLWALCATTCSCVPGMTQGKGSTGWEL